MDCKLVNLLTYFLLTAAITQKPIFLCSQISMSEFFFFFFFLEGKHSCLLRPTPNGFIILFGCKLLIPLYPSHPSLYKTLRFALRYEYNQQKLEQRGKSSFHSSLYITMSHADGKRIKKSGCNQIINEMMPDALFCLFAANTTFSGLARGLIDFFQSDDSLGMF